MITIETSPNAGYFRIDGIDYPKGHYTISYDTLNGSEDERNFSLCSVYDNSELIKSRGYSEIVGVTSWDELLTLFGNLGVLSGQGFESEVSEFRTPMYQFLDTVGDGSGSQEQSVDGSTTPVSFKLTPPEGVVYGVARVIFSLSDGGTMDSGGWGNSSNNPLANGIEILWHTSGQVINLTNTPIRSHIDIAAICYDVSHNGWGQGNEFIVARFTFTKAGQFLKLDGSQGDYLELIVNDDLTYLVSQKLSAQGFQI